MNGINITRELIGIVKEIEASGKIAMAAGDEDNVRTLLEAAKRSLDIMDKLAKSFAPMSRALRHSEVERPTAEAIDAMFGARSALGKLVGVCSSALVEHETAFLSSEKE